MSQFRERGRCQDKQGDAETKKKMPRRASSADSMGKAAGPGRFCREEGAVSLSNFSWFSGRFSQALRPEPG